MVTVDDVRAVASELPRSYAERIVAAARCSPPGDVGEPGAAILHEVSFNERYWRVVFPVWVVASTGCAAVAAVTSVTWAEAVTFAFGWGLFAVALWWTLDTVRAYIWGQQADSPEAILKARLARGEISTEEYERLRDTLTQP